MADAREDEASQGSGAAPTAGSVPILEQVKAKPLDATLNALRLLTIVFGLAYAVPVFGPAAQLSAYSKTLMAAAATDGLRLYQRTGPPRFSRDYLGVIMLEDSAHYLFYCLIFLSVFPVTMPLMPPFLFAVLHASSYTLQLLRAAGRGDGFPSRQLSAFVGAYSQVILSVIATTEIFLMPMNVVMIFMGKGNFLFPFIYYRFLCMRYISRRNPNTRVAFAQMRVALEQAVNRPACPAFLANSVHKAIGLLCRLAPQAV